MQLYIETEINASAEIVWHILAHQFGDITDWSSTIKISREIAPTEVPNGFTPAADAPVPGRETTAALGKFTEIITEYSEEKMTLKFEGANLPPVLAFANDIQRVVPRGSDKCLLTFDIHIQPRGILKVIDPVLKRRFGSTMELVQRELKSYAETGQIAA